MVLTMPPFSPIIILCYFSRGGKYYVFKSWVRKIEMIGRINAYIERVVRCSAFGTKRVESARFPTCLRRMMS